MYFWKCWRDSRIRFIFFLSVATVSCVLFTIMWARPGGTMKGGLASGVLHLWSDVAEGVLGMFCSIIALFAALSLAVQSIGQEFKRILTPSA